MQQHHHRHCTDAAAADAANDVGCSDPEANSSLLPNEASATSYANPNASVTVTSSLSKIIHHFCEHSSIRGVPKIAKSPSGFMRRLWLAFVLVMTSVLFVSSSLSVKAYLQYDVIVQTSDIPKFVSEFPAITLCLHQPFSTHAFELWSNQTVMSPKKFNRRLRNWALKSIKSLENFAEITNAEADPIYYSLYYDMLEMYYQNLYHSDIIRLSHDTTVIRKCIVKTTGGVSHFKDPCNLTEHGFSIKLFSHPKHLNCYTVEPKSQSASFDTNFLGLAVDLGPKPDFANLQQGFLNDVFDQATGLRVVIHEPLRYPDVENFGKNIEAGKMTELAYTPTLWNRSDTPANPCVNGGKSFVDVDRDFHYTQRECTNGRMQDQIVQLCKCIIALPGFPRPQPPTLTLPYCGSFTELFNRTFKDFANSVSCFGNISINLPKPCMPRCKFYEYDTKLSVTDWGATDWQVYWSGRYVNDVEDLSRLIATRDQSRRSMKKEFNELKDRLLQYLTAKNLSSADADKMVRSKNFAYVVLKRKGENLVLKEEKQVLTLNALMSQIGGLCSLTIGLTCAFAIEIVEFLYLCCKCSTNNNNNSNNNNNNNKNNRQRRSEYCDRIHMNRMAIATNSDD